MSKSEVFAEQGDKTRFWRKFSFSRNPKDTQVVNPKVQMLEFSRKLGLPNMSGKFWHLYFWVDKLGIFRIPFIIIFFTFCSIKHYHLKQLWWKTVKWVLIEFLESILSIETTDIFQFGHRSNDNSQILDFPQTSFFSLFLPDKSVGYILG